MRRLEWQSIKLERLLIVALRLTAILQPVNDFLKVVDRINWNGILIVFMVKIQQKIQSKLHSIF